MKVERTLLTVFPVCDAVKDGACIGCCQCDDSACADKIINFGNAIECPSTVACSSGCPRAIQKEDIEDAKDKKERKDAEDTEEKLFSMAKEWYKNTPEYQTMGRGAGKISCRGVLDLQRYLNVSREKATELYDRIIDDKYKPAESASVTPVPDSVVINVRYYGGTHIARAVGLGITASSTSDYEPAARAVAVKIYGDDNFELIQYGPAHTWIAKPLASKPVINEKQYDKDLANAAKVPLDLTVYKLDLENKKIFSYDHEKKKFVLDSNCISKAATLREFKRLQKNETGFLDIDRITTWPSNPDLAQFTLFQGDYHGAVYDHKQIRFIKPGMHGWGKHQKFSNLEQYNEALADYRKDPNYIEA